MFLHLTSWQIAIADQAPYNFVCFPAVTFFIKFRTHGRMEPTKHDLLKALLGWGQCPSSEYVSTIASSLFLQPPWGWFLSFLKPSVPALISQLSVHFLRRKTWNLIYSLFLWLGPAKEKAMAPHSTTLAWKIPWTEEPGRLQSLGSWRVGRDWATSLSLFTFMHWRRKWQPTPVFLPGESQGRGSLVGCCRWGHTESDMTDET